MELYESAIRECAWREIPRGVLRAEGADARKWLHKIVTANAEQLPSGSGAHSALLDAKGHFVADFVLLRDGNIYGLLCDDAARANLFNVLKRYIIREKVTLTDVTERWTCFVFVGEQAPAQIERVLDTSAPSQLYAWTWGKVGADKARVIRMPRARVPAFDVMVPANAAPFLRDALNNVSQLSDEILETLRVETGQPKWGVDFDANTLALEIPDVMQIRVDQGCYVGQEVVARIVHRGHVNRHLRGLWFDADALPARGQAIQFNDAEVGSVTSAARSPLFGSIAFGYVRREVELGAQVNVNGMLARVVELPFTLP